MSPQIQLFHRYSWFLQESQFIYLVEKCIANEECHKVGYSTSNTDKPAQTSKAAWNTLVGKEWLIIHDIQLTP